jgi:hypothetical protein
MGDGSRYVISFFRILKKVRHMVSDLKLWCDMICIDQHSIKERGFQVGMMGEIYNRTHCVWIWLGDQAEGSNVVFEFLDGEDNVLVRNDLTVDLSKRIVPKTVDIRKAHLCAEEIPKAWVPPQECGKEKVQQLQATKSSEPV